MPYETHKQSLEIGFTVDAFEVFVCKQDNITELMMRYIGVMNRLVALLGKSGH
jgi:hypothetical protein